MNCLNTVHSGCDRNGDPGARLRDELTRWIFGRDKIREPGRIESTEPEGVLDIPWVGLWIQIPLSRIHAIDPQIA